MPVIVLYLIYTKFEFRKLYAPKTWLIFSHGAKRTGDLDLCPFDLQIGLRASFLSIFILLRLSILDLRSGTGQPDDGHERLMSPTLLGGGHNNLV